MRFGVNTFLWAARFGEEQHRLLPALRENGFDGVEVPLIQTADFDAAGIRRATEANGLACTVCSVLPGGLSLCNEDSLVRQQAREQLRTAIALTAEAGAKLIAGPLYSPVGFLPGRRRTTDEWQHVVEAYQELGDTLRAHDVTIAIEPLNRFETYFLNTADDAAALCDEINHPRVGILFDTFHANIEEPHLVPAVRAVARHLKHVHTCENDRGTPGSGHVDWNGLFTVLREIGYDEWLTIESFGFALGELSAAASIWRDLAPSSEYIAYEGVRFLREQAASHA